MTHAALRYIEKRGVRLRHWQHDTNEPREELLCDAVGHRRTGSSGSGSTTDTSVRVR